MGITVSTVAALRTWGLVLEACSNGDWHELLPSIQVPTLVVHRIGDTSERVEQARYIGERSGTGATRSIRPATASLRLDRSLERHP